jgi:hypothetical protein
VTGLLLLLALASSDEGDARELETDGRLWEAGALYEECGSAAGQARVLCALLEEALYAGHANRAQWLISDLEGMGADPSLLDYWYARLAWTCGLDSLARAWLDAVGGEPWLSHRARGTSLLYAGDAEGACTEFILSWHGAGSVRRRYYASLDLCLSLTAAGRIPEASAAARFLEGAFPHEGLPRVLAALAELRGGSVSAGTAMLQEVCADESLSVSTRSMARDLLEDVE